MQTLHEAELRVNCNLRLIDYAVDDDSQIGKGNEDLFELECKPADTQQREMVPRVLAADGMAWDSFILLLLITIASAFSLGDLLLSLDTLAQCPS